MTTDPFADQPARWVGKPCSFDYEGKRLVGTIESHTYIGRTAIGNINDYAVKIRGASGKLLTVSYVESHLDPQ